MFDIREGAPNKRVKFIKGDLVKLVRGHCGPCFGAIAPPFHSPFAFCQEEVVAAFQGIECVFHVASPAHDASDAILTKVNVEGTRNVVQACLDAKVPRLVFTSSASVVYAGADQENVDETLPYPSEFRCVSRTVCCELAVVIRVVMSCSDTYARTKAMAEKAVLQAAADSRTPINISLWILCAFARLMSRCATAGGRLSVVSVRPHGLFGPRDPTLMTTLVKTCQVCVMGHGASRHALISMLPIPFATAGWQDEVRHRHGSVCLRVVKIVRTFASCSNQLYVPSPTGRCQTSRTSATWCSRTCWLQRPRFPPPKLTAR